MIQETITYLIGDVPRPNLAGNLILGFVGMLLPMAWKVMRRDPHDPRTPVKFSFRFFIIDSIKSLISRLIFLVVIIVFIAPYCKVELNPVISLLIGAALPEIVSKIMGSLPQIVQSLLPSRLNNLAMPPEFYWEMDFENEDDLVFNFVEDKSTTTLADFAANTKGELSGKVITYQIEPSYGEITIQRADITQYSSAPIKKPNHPI